MTGIGITRAGVFVKVLFLLCLAIPKLVGAELLPINIYTTSNGLPHNRIKSILQDRQGFLWFGTVDGLSRFDGTQFINFNTENGLPHATVNSILQSRDGAYWIATNGGGVCTSNPLLMNSHANPRLDKFLFCSHVYRVGDSEITNRVNVLYEDRAGRIWAGTDSGMFQYDPSHKETGFRSVEIGLLTTRLEEAAVTSMIEDKRGDLWIGTGGSGLIRIHQNGHVERYGSSQGFPVYPIVVWSLMEDQNDQIWSGTNEGLYQLLSKPDSNGNVIAHAYKEWDQVTLDARGLHQSPDGSIWIGTSTGLLVFDGAHFKKYTVANGLSENEINCLVFDRDENLWIGTAVSGVSKLASFGFTTFGTNDGLANLETYSIFENPAGKLFATSGNWTIHAFDGTRFTAVRPQLPPSVVDYGWGWRQTAFLERTGQWWITTDRGIFRFEAPHRIEQLAHALPNRVFTTNDGLTSETGQVVFEDSRGDVWISTITRDRTGLSRLDSKSGQLHHYSSADGLPAVNWPKAFSEDRAGNLWIGFHYGGLARYKNGHFKFFTEADGLPRGPIRALYTDQRGWLWIATERSGIRCAKNPDSEDLQLTSYTTEQGLTSNNTWCFAEDNQNRIYVGTSRGLDSLDLENNFIRHYTIADGLADNMVQTAYRDHQEGMLWFGTPKGISRFSAPDQKSSFPSVLISGFKVDGIPQPLSVLGESQISGLTLDTDQNQLEINFSALSLNSGDQLRFRHKLEGPEQDWSDWNNLRTIYYARLSPGKYRFQVQAKNADGEVSRVPASIAFIIRSPYWQRWWFISLALSFVLLAGYGAFRYRLVHLLRLERVRTQIASDLHDDIGLSLSHIAVLSEVLRKKIVDGSADLSDALTQIGRVSREAVDSMSDIVWAVNPQKDHMMDLERRMRHAANEILFATNTAFTFQPPDCSDSLRVGADVRRQVLLIFKESLNNIVRHSACSKVQIKLEINRGILLLIVEDNGKGFDGNDLSEGNGLANMKKRAGSVKGMLNIESASGSGTMVRLSVPLA
jgi:ligand-binding sensor domain-containing protein/two-component sensor histidine kinase